MTDYRNMSKWKATHIQPVDELCYYLSNWIYMATSNGNVRSDRTNTPIDSENIKITSLNKGIPNELACVYSATVPTYKSKVKESWI